MSKQLVVIGAGMGGLSAAIYGRLCGYDVLVLEKSKSVGGKAAGIKIGRYNLDPGPSIIILPRIYEQVFLAARRKMSDYLQFHRLEVISRVFMDNEPPLDLVADENKCLRLLEELSPHDANALRGLFDKIAKVEPLLNKTIYNHAFVKPAQLLDPRLIRFGIGFNPLKSFKELVDPMFETPLVRAFFYGFPSYGGQTYAAKSPGAFLIPYYMLREGVYFPVGGVRAIPIAFQRLAEELGVKFRFRTEVASVAGSDCQMKSVSLTTGEKIEADAFISNLDKFSFSAMRGQKMEAEPSFSYFTVHHGIRKQFSNLEHHNLFIPKSFEQGFEDLYTRGTFPKEPIVYLNSTTKLDKRAAPKGASNLFAVVTSPAKVPGIDWPKSEADFKRRVQKVLCNAGISWEESEIEFTRIQTPETFESAHGSFRGSLYGLHESHRLWGIFPASNLDDRWKNLTYCGGSVQPGAGLPMVTLSGKFAVNLLETVK